MCLFICTTATWSSWTESKPMLTERKLTAPFIAYLHKVLVVNWTEATTYLASQVPFFSKWIASVSGHRTTWLAQVIVPFFIHTMLFWYMCTFKPKFCKMFLDMNFFRRAELNLKAQANCWTLANWWFLRVKNDFKKLTVCFANFYTYPQVNHHNIWKLTVDFAYIIRLFVLKKP